ncbi:MAG: hypothetical protein WBM02_00830 [bacterium]
MMKLRIKLQTSLDTNGFYGGLIQTASGNLKAIGILLTIRSVNLRPVIFYKIS